MRKKKRRIKGRQSPSQSDIIFRMLNIIRTNPIVQIEQKTLSSLRRSRIDRILNRYKKAFLYEQDPDEVIPTFQEILNEINYSVLKPPNKPWEINYTYKNSSGTTKVHLFNEYELNKPTLIFHHGLGSRNQLHLKIFLNEDIVKRFNIFSIRASNHESTAALLKNCINNFTNLATTTCASVLATDEVVDFHKNNSSRPVFMVGLSLGGVVTCMHYYFFNAADMYFPILAYPNVGEIVIHKSHKGFIYNFDKISKNRTFFDSFNIPKELKDRASRRKILPVLGKKDELINYDDASKFWKGYKLKTFDVGHYTIALKVNEIRKHVLYNVARIRK